MTRDDKDAAAEGTPADPEGSAGPVNSPDRPIQAGKADRADGADGDERNAEDRPGADIPGAEDASAGSGAAGEPSGPAPAGDADASESVTVETDDASTPDASAPDIPDAPAITDDGHSTGDATAHGDEPPASDAPTPTEGGDADNAAIAPAPPRDLAEAVERAEQEQEDGEGGRSMTLLDHLSELRVRLVRCLIALAVGFFACYGFAEELFNFLMIPLMKALPAGGKLIYTALPEAFFVYMQVALVAGAFVASPFLFYQIWAFIAPGLYAEERRHVVPIALASALFFVSGAAFCYFQVFPYAFEFFVGFATDIIEPMPKLDEYLGFTLKMLLAFGLIFEMPLFAFFLARLGLVTAAWMRKTRKYAILAIFIVAAILTPPDVFSQLMMAAPMLVLYEISILVAAVFGKKKAGDDGEEGKDEEEKTGPETVVQGD